MKSDVRSKSIKLTSAPSGIPIGILCKAWFRRGRKGKTTSREVSYLYSGKEGRQSA